MNRWLVITFFSLTIVSLATIAVFPGSMAQFSYVVPIMFLFIAIGAFLLLLLHYAYSLLELRKDLVLGALGLPDGSIRAFLTIGLLALVAVFGSFIYFESGKPGVYTIVRADVPAETPEALAALIKAVGDKFVVVPKGKTADVVSSTADTTRADVAKQLLTVLSTVLTTVIGFYFGSTTAPASGVSGPGPDRGPVGPIAPFTVTPGAGRPGTRVTISGTGFGTEKGRVSFGNTPAEMADATWGDGEIAVNVPPTAPPGRVQITVTPAGSNQGLVSGTEFEILAAGAP